MKASEVYDKFILKSEKNSTNDNISTDKQRVAELYNEWSVRLLEYLYDNKADDDIRYINGLLVPNKKLTEFKKDQEAYSFKLPDNYFDLSSAYALGSQNECSNQKIFLFAEIDDFNKPYYLSDEFTKPSFKYRESIYNIGGNSINVYYNDFVINSVILSYYRYPKKIQLQDPNNPESDFDDSYELDFDDRVTNRIISAAVSGLDLNNSSERWQLNNAFAKKEL